AFFAARRMPAADRLSRSRSLMSSANLGFLGFGLFATWRTPAARRLSRSRSLNSSVNLGFRAFAFFAARACFGAAFFLPARRGFDAVFRAERFLVEDFLAMTVPSGLMDERRWFCSTPAW